VKSPVLTNHRVIWMKNFGNSSGSSYTADINTPNVGKANACATVLAQKHLKISENPGEVKFVNYGDDALNGLRKPLEQAQRLQEARYQAFLKIGYEIKRDGNETLTDVLSDREFLGKRFYAYVDAKGVPIGIVALRDEEKIATSLVWPKHHPGKSVSTQSIFMTRLAAAYLEGGALYPAIGRTIQKAYAILRDAGHRPAAVEEVPQFFHIENSDRPGFPGLRTYGEAVRILVGAAVESQTESDEEKEEDGEETYGDVDFNEEDAAGQLSPASKNDKGKEKVEAEESAEADENEEETVEL